ncbi:MAG: AAA family ATPase [Chloroflexi bacterium]|nr:AAA family ATPase [Chloroflexota bacterium]
MSILILGPPVVLLDGKPLKISRREQRAGLFFLAGQKEPISRSELCELFWPKNAEIDARKKLREGLSRLSSTLHDPRVIIKESDFLFLDPTRVYVDDREFNFIIQPIVNCSEMNSFGKLPDWLYTQLRKAINLCRGTQFLQGFNWPNSSGFENWQAATNQSYSFTREKIVERLTDHCITIGNIDEAIFWLESAIKMDPFNTDTNFLLANCLKDTGRTKDAIDFIDYLEKLHNANQHQGLPQVLKDFQIRLEEIKSSHNNDSKKNWPAKEQESIPFIGRNDLLKRLNNAFHRKGIVHIKGESGSGKTRLVREFYSRLEQKPRLLYFQAKPWIKTSPFSLLVEGLWSQVEPEEWLLLPVNIQNDLAFLFPQLTKRKKHTNTVKSGLPTDEPLLSLFHALHFLLLKLAEKSPLLFIIDIAAWCDDGTIKFLSYLNGQQFFKKHGLLVLSSRSEDENPLLEIYIESSVLKNQLEKISLELFSIEETTQLITSITGKIFSDELIRKLQIETGGNPFCLIETFRALKDLNFDTKNFSKDDLYPVPTTVLSLVNEKVRRLSKSANEILKAAAVVGRQFSSEIIELMVDLSTQDLLSGLEELQQASILVADSEHATPGRYSFLHGQICDVILKSLSPARKRNLHLLAVKAMKEKDGESLEQAPFYAYHYEQAGEFTMAFQAWCSVARLARSRFLIEDTYAAFQRALDLLPVLTTQFSEKQIYPLIVEWADFAYDLSDDLTCEKVYRLCQEIGERNQSALLIGTSLSGFGRVQEMRFQYDEGIEKIHQALFFLSKTNSRGEELEAYTRLGILHNLKNDYAGCEKWLLKGSKIILDYSEQRILDASVNCQTQLSMLYTLTGRLKEAEIIANQATNISKLVMRGSAKVQAHCALAMSQLYGAKYKKSIENALLVYDLAYQLRMEWWTSLLDLILARNYLAYGNLDSSWSYAEHVIEWGSRYARGTISSHGWAIKGDIYRILGDQEAAEASYRLGIQKPLTNYQALENLYSLGITQYQKKQFDEGLSTLDKAISISERLGLYSITLPAQLLKYSFTAATLPDEELNNQGRQIEAEMQKRGFGSSWAKVEKIAGDLAVKKGDLEAARKSYQKVAVFGKTIGHIWIEMAAYPGLLSTYQAGDPERREIQARITEIMDEISLHVTHQSIKTIFNKFREQWERY